MKLLSAFYHQTWNNCSLPSHWITVWGCFQDSCWLTWPQTINNQFWFPDWSNFWKRKPSICYNNKTTNLILYQYISFQTPLLWSPMTCPSDGVLWYWEFGNGLCLAGRGLSSINGSVASFMFLTLFLNGVILLGDCCCLKASTNQDDIKQLILTKTACCVASRCVFWLKFSALPRLKTIILVACTFCSAWDAITLQS